MLLMMRRFVRLGEVRSVLLSVLAGFFLLGLFEIIYSIIILHTNNHIKLCVLFVVPFCIAALYYRIRPSKLTWIFLAVWVLLWVIWVIPGGRWDIYAHGHINYPINWPIYQLYKVIKVAFILVVYSLSGGRAKSLDRLDFRDA